MNWWYRLLRRDRMERELNAELQFHFDELVRDHIRAGLSEQEARRRARQEFGQMEGLKEDCRDARGTRWIDDTLRDIRFASRLLVRERTLTIVAVLALGLGIGVNNTLFTILNAVCLRGLQVRGIERLADLSSRNAGGRLQPITAAEVDAIQRNVAAFDEVAAYSTTVATIGDAGGAPDRIRLAYVSPNAGRLVGQMPRIGRAIQPEDDRPGAAAVVVLGDAIWRTRYAGDPSIVGRSVLLDDRPAAVIGVMPEGVRFPDDADVWQPMRTRVDAATATSARRLGAFAHLRDGETIARASEQVRALSASLERQDPARKTAPELTVSPLNDRFKGRVTDPAWLAFMTVGILLVIIACSNVANLLLARAVRRSREIAIRLSIGATRGRILRQLLAESMMLAAIGGVVGLGLSLIGLRVFRNAIPPTGLPYWMTITMDARVFGVLGTVCLGTVAIFGLAPAVHTLRTAMSDVLKETAQSTSNTIRARRWSAMFLTTQLAIAVILLSAVGLTLQSFWSSQRTRQPVHTTDVLSMWMSLPQEAYKSGAERQLFVDRLKERLASLNDVASAGVADALPFGGAAPRRVIVEGRPPEAKPPTVWSVAVGEGYFETLGLPIVQGRSFAATDGVTGDATVIVNQRFAQMFFPGEQAPGHRIDIKSTDGNQVPLGGTGLTIVGIAANVGQRDGPEPEPLVYVPMRKATPATIALLIRTAGDAAALAPRVRDEARRLDARVPLYRVMTLDQVNWETRWNGRVAQGIITVVASIALILAMFGLAALTAHNVAQRRREIGIRMALGARGGEVIRLVLRRASFQVTTGLLAGIGGAWMWDRVFGPAGMSAIGNIAIVSAVVMIVAVAACIWPALQAARLNPLDTLRHE
jgi:putative ABC transport system permease protein